MDVFNEKTFSNSEYLEQYNCYGLKEFAELLVTPSFITATKLHEVIVEKNGMYAGALSSRVLAATKYIITCSDEMGSSRARKVVQSLIDRLSLNDLCLQLNNALGPGAAIVQMDWANADLIGYTSISPVFLSYHKHDTVTPGYFLDTKAGRVPYENIQDDVLLYTPKLLNPYHKIRLGLVWRAALPYFLQTIANSNWLRYTGAFGKPFRNAKLPKRLTESASRLDPKVKAQVDVIRRALVLIGQDGYSMLPDDVELELFVSAVNANPAIFKELIDSEVANLLIAIQGQTLTTLAGGARADSEVKFEIKKELLDHDLNNIQTFLNQTLIPLVCRKNGIELKDYPMIVIRHDDSLGKDMLIETALQAVDRGFDVDPEWFESVSGVKLKSYDILAKVVPPQQKS